MPDSTQKRPLYLCGGLQGSGSSLVSWSFLQRQDMNGVFDTAHDMVPILPELPASIRTWCKITTCCFRTSELKDYYASLGWAVVPILITRDVREVWSSLQDKQYGRNATTAEDPPLRLRMLRFLSDWENAVRGDWTTVRYESLISQPRQTLMATCRALEIPWDQGMIDWPKERSQIADARYGNVNFLASRTNGLMETLDPKYAGQLKGAIAEADLQWLEETFAKYNIACGYAEKRTPPASPRGYAVADFNASRRSEWTRKPSSQTWLHRIGLRR
ncbi:MAG: sulfotransferase [Planctomycetaceae bacterium]|nr:sulfotransferase [Planctomycetaceae bacterium]